MSWTIVTAADAAYFPLLKGLIASIVDRAPTMPDLCVMDLGLTDEQRTWLARFAKQIVSPAWHVSDDDAQKLESTLGTKARAMTARPHLPSIFPGYETYLWLDSDLWVQRWDAIEWCLQAAAAGDVAVAQQLDRAFRCTYHIGELTNVLYRVYQSCVPEQMAQQLAYLLPQVNSGVLAARTDSKLWGIWQREVQNVLAATWASGKPITHIFEQIALNVVIYSRGVNGHFLPSTCNWIVGDGPPRFDSERKTLCHPFVPYDTLGIIHLILSGAGAAGKLAPVTLPSNDGATKTLQLDYLAFRRDVLHLGDFD